MSMMLERAFKGHKYLSSGLVVLALMVSLLFAIKALCLIDRSSLWGDELRTVIKAFQPSVPFIFDYLKTDSHPPLYYLMLWGWGQSVGQSAISLRLFSWLAYLVGGILMTIQAAGLARRRGRAVALAALLAFCTPFPVRFSIEGKGYALLVAMLALALLIRRLILDRASFRPTLNIAYGLAVALASLTHYYGFGLICALLFWDGLHRRCSLVFAALIGIVPSSLWIIYSSGHLFNPSTNLWIAPPEFSLLSTTLIRALGVDPFWKLGGLTLLILALNSWGHRKKLVEVLDADARSDLNQLLDRSGIWGGVVLVLIVVGLSYLKPIAFSRYFVVLVPVVVPALAAAAADWSLRYRGEWFALLILTMVVLHYWHAAFTDINPPQGEFRRERSDFRSVSLRLADESWRYADRSKLFNASDQMLVAAGSLKPNQKPWGDKDDLRSLLTQGNSPEQFYLAASGRKSKMKKRLNDLKVISDQNGYQCFQLDDLPRGAMVLNCQQKTHP